MIPQTVEVKPEWPKYLFGPDGQRARFDAEGDIPRDYTEHPPGKKAPAAGPVDAAPADHEMTEFAAWKAAKAKKVAVLAKAREAKKAKAQE